MTDATADKAEAPQKSGKKGLVLAVILAGVGAGAGYVLTTSGLLPLGGPADSATAEKSEEAEPIKALADVSFVDLPPVIISVDSDAARHLKFHAQLEVDAPYVADVEKMKPRIMDVLNSYLRAIEVSDLEDSLALTRIRGHLHRRIGIVVGDGRVRDVLVMEFVLN